MDTEQLTEYIRKAFEYKELKNYKKAADYFYKALTMDSGSSEIMCELAFLYEQLKKPDRAIEYLEQALLKKPDDERILFKLSSVLRNTGEYEKAEKILSKLCRKNPQETEFFVQYIYSLLLQGKFSKILDSYQNYNSEQGNNSNLLYYVGLSYENLYKTKEAEAFYKAALSVDASNFDAGFRYASLLFEEKKYPESEKILHTLMKDKPNAYISYLLGEINFIKNNYDDAIKYLATACKSDSKNPSYFYELATAYSLKGFLKEAEQNYIEAIKLDPNNLSYNYSLAYLYYTNNASSKTLRVLDYILSVNPQQPNALTLKAQLMLDNNDIVLADKLIKQALKLNYKNDYAHFVMANIFARLSWWEKALSSAEKAVELNPKSIEYKIESAKFALNCGDLDKAIKISNSILKLSPTLIDAMIIKVEALIRRQNFSEAKRTLSQIFKLDMNVAKAHFFKALILKQSEKYNEAINEFKMALEIDPGNVLCFENIADCYYKQENYYYAYQFYKEASNLDITQAKYKHMMAKISVLQNDSVNAISNFILAKRLEPANLSVIKDYFSFLCSVDKTKEALAMLKDSKKFLLNENEIKTVDTLIKNFEK